jgi:hypothetical protein
MPSLSISVVMPVCDVRRYIAEGAASVLQQTFGDYAFLVFDDGSTVAKRSLLKPRGVGPSAETRAAE